MSRELSKAEAIAALPAAERDAFWAALSPAEAAALEFKWEFWARDSQLEPAGNWRTWLFCAGRGAGKTRCGAEWIRANLTGSTPLSGGKYRHACLLAETAAAARDVMVGDPFEHSNPAAGSGILQVCPKDYLPLYEPSKRRLTFPNGAICSIFNAQEYDALRGPQFDCCWIDELARFQYGQQAFDMLAFCLRLGKNPRTFISTTPRPTALIKSILADKTTHVTRGSTHDNAMNLAPQFLEAIMSRYAGTRLGRQEIDAELISEIPGALWNYANLDANRIKLSELPIMKRIVVAIDPAVSTSEKSDETGITACGVGENDRFYVLDDISGVYSPLEWAKRAVSLYHARRADMICCESNQGGDLVVSTLQQVDPNVPITKVFATKGKFLRCEPIAALYEQNRVSHVGRFDELELQMTSFCVDFDRKSMGWSPDRLDSLTWAMTSLLDGMADTRRPIFLSLDMYGHTGISAPADYAGRY
jgi:phage terminase large subunit-like protein